MQVKTFVKMGNSPAVKALKREEIGSDKKTPRRRREYLSSVLPKAWENLLADQEGAWGRCTVKAPPKLAWSVQ